MQFAVRRRNGTFEDIQDIGRASRMDQRRTHLVTADRRGKFDEAAFRARREREMERINEELGGGMGRQARQDFAEATEQMIAQRRQQAP